MKCVLTELLGEFEGISGTLEARTGDNEFCATDLSGSLNDTLQVIGVSLRAVVAAAEYRVGQIDANLLLGVLD